MFRWHVVSAVFWRNVKQYFSGVLGYLFIVTFVLICAVLAFNAQFFADNLANLDQLSQWYPALLLFFIPAITMTVWAEEQRRGTDAILFTLPASDFEILFGKYLSVVAVYTIALLFSSTQLIALSLIGDPDWGVISATYLGYWLSGLALLAIGMFASSLTSSATVAFVLGAVFCAVPVMIGYYFHGIIWLEKLGIDWNLQDFTIGLVPLSSIFYFISLIGFMLYLNLIVISKRHWSRGQSVSLAGHFFVRVLFLAVGIVALNYLVGTASAYLMTRLDLTGEKLYSLDETTLATIETARENERQVTIQAFVSREVPRKYVNTKKQFMGMLRQYDLYGGNYVDVVYKEVDPDSREEQEAQTLGIEPQDDRSDVGGRTVEQNVYMGARISSSLDDVTLPFFDNDSSIEYELSRSIATTTDKKRQLTIGVLDSDAHFGGPIFEGRRIEWGPYVNTMANLKKQFKIKHITQNSLIDYVEPAQPIGEQNEDSAEPPQAKEAPDVLIVADPSSLATPATDALIKYLKAGNPAIILADPLPFFWPFQHPTQIGVLNAPRQPRVPQQTPYAQILTSSPMPKDSGGTADKLLTLLGLEWDNGQAAWNLFNPHPGFEAPRWQEYYGPYERAFVWVRSHGDFTAFNDTNIISSGLNELLFFYPGSIKKAPQIDTKFDPLITIGVDSGVSDWDNLTTIPKQKMPRFDPNTGRQVVEERAARSQITMGDLVVIEPNPQSYLDDDQHVIAAHVTGNNLNAVFVADLDFVSDLYYAQQQSLEQQSVRGQLDNLSFLQNAIEVLAGDEGFVSLRNRRPSPRTLTKVESVLEGYRAERAGKQEEAEKRVRDQLEKAQQELDEAAKEIGENQSLSFFEKLQRTSQEASDTQRRFNLKKEKLDKELKKDISLLKSEEKQKTSDYERRIRLLAILLAPLPAFLLGIFVLSWRAMNERKHIEPDRRV